MAEGRDPAPAAVDQPKLTAGHWVGRGDGVVIERGFAAALGVQLGAPVTLGGSTFHVTGIAATAAIPAYPVSFCNHSCGMPEALQTSRSGEAPVVGLVWVTRPAAQHLTTTASPLGYLLNLKLTDPLAAQAFATVHTGPPSQSAGTPTGPPGSARPSSAGGITILYSWQGIRSVDNLVASNEQKTMQFGGALLALLALAGLTVLIGRRMAEQTKRVGLLKAVGGTPGLIAAVLLAQYLLIAVIAAAVGLVAGRLIATPVARTSAGLLGAPSSPSLTAPTITFVVAVALAVAGIVAVLASYTYNARNYAGVDNLRIDRVNELTAIITVMLAILAAINTIFITWATVVDARPASALTRALGATPNQVSAGLSAAQLLPTLPGAVLGIPIGIYLYHAVAEEQLTVPPVWQLLAVLLGTLLVVAALTAIPSRLGAQRSPADILQGEVA
jgi:putative ABC transport system permease protein